MKELDETEEMGPLSAVVEKLGRRSFLQKLVMGAVGLATALAGLPQRAEAVVQVTCCLLCKSPTSCSGACCWTWGCCYSDNRFRRCKECYTASAACDGSCTGVVCSQAILTALQC